MDWLKSLAQLAPTVATALGGPLAGAAVSAIGSVLGLTDAKPADIAKAFKDGQLTPEQITQIRELELKYQAEEKERGFRYEELAYKDRDSARQANVASKSLTPAVLSYLITVGFFGILGWMLYDDNVVNSPPLLVMLGSLGTAWTGVCAYWFGTTANSKNKDELLANSIPAK